MDYETLVKMTGFLEAAADLGFGNEDDLPDGILDDITEIQNRINARRLALLGNGQDMPYNVDDLMSGRTA